MLSSRRSDNLIIAASNAGATLKNEWSKKWISEPAVQLDNRDLFFGQVIEFVDMMVKGRVLSFIESRTQLPCDYSEFDSIRFS